MKTENLIIAYDKGYRVLQNGDVISHLNKKIRLNKKTVGYLKFNIYHKNKIITIFVHQLQAFQKFGEKKYKNSEAVRHLNGDKLDNSYKNIDVGTHRQNSMDIPESVRYSRSLYANSFLEKYDRDKVVDFYLESGRSYKKTMEKFNMPNPSSLHFILKKQFLKHKTNE